AVISTFGLVLPAFLMFEPRATEEGLELHLIILAFFGAAIVALTLIRGWQVLRATRCLEKEWLRRAERIFPHGLNVPVYRVENEKSLIAVTGIFRARIFVARGVAENLSCEELQAALAHEMAHAAAYDNLKQLLLKMTRLPRWLKPQKADIEWVNASELS